MLAWNMHISKVYPLRLFKAFFPARSTAFEGLVDLGNDTGSDGLSTFTESESRTWLQSNVVNEVSNHLDVVTGHDL